MSATRRTRLADAGTYLAYFVICLFFAGPLLWIFSLSIRTAAEVYVSDIRIWPRMPTLENYWAALGNPLFLTYLANGLKLAVGGALGAMLFATPAAYALSRFRFRNRNLAMIGLLAFQMISPLVIMVPLYRYMDRLGHDRQPARRRLHLHRGGGAALHLDAQGLPRRHPAEPRGGGDDRRLHPLRRLHARGAAAQPARPHLRLRAERDPRLVAVHHPLHPDLASRACCRSRSASSTSRAPTTRPRPRSSPPRACSPSSPPSSSSSCCSASSSAR